MKVQIAASMMCADLTRLAEQVTHLEEAGVDLLHFDLMDGRFVPNLALGPDFLRRLRPLTHLPFEAHLMVESPEVLFPSLLEAGCDRVVVHLEACPHLRRTLQEIRRAGMEAGVALNPATPIDFLPYVVDLLDVVLFMTVDPGFAGQPFVPSVLPKIEAAYELLQARGRVIDLEVDGSVNEQTIPLVVSRGANVLVGGSTGLFTGEDVRVTVRRMREAAHAQD